MADNKETGKKNKKTEAAAWGKFAEELTHDYLVKRGHPITEKNWRHGNHIEIDIISQQGDEMVFIEVKARNGRYDAAEDAIDAKKIKQLVKGADIYLRTLDKDFTARFDVALVEGNPDDYEFTYIRDAFVPPLNAR